MRLWEVIEINDAMTPELPEIISFIAAAATWAVMAVELQNSIELAVAMIAIVTCIIAAYIPLKHIFSKSLFGEEAYRYMMLPISFKAWVFAKIYSGAKSCFATVLILMLCIYYFMIWFFNSGGTEYGEFVTNSAVALLNAHAALSDDIMTTNSVIFIIAAFPITAMLESAFVSAVILSGVVIKNLMDSRREKPQLAIGIGIVAILVYLVASFLFIWIPGLFFKNDLAVPQLIIAAGLKLTAAYGLARCAEHLLEKKYTLN